MVEYDTCRSLPVHAQYIYHIIKKPFGEPVKQFVKKNDVEKNFRYFDDISAYGSEVEEKGNESLKREIETAAYSTDES